MTWRPHFTKLRLEAPVTNEASGTQLDKTHDAYAAWLRLVYCAINPSAGEIQLQVSLVDLAQLLFQWPPTRALTSKDRMVRERRAAIARGEPEPYFGGAGDVQAQIGGDLLQLHTVDGRDYKTTTAYLAETAVLDKYKQLLHQHDRPATSGTTSVKRPTDEDTSAVELLLPRRKRSRGSRGSSSRTSESAVNVDGQCDSAKLTSSRQTGAGTRLPDVWFLASAYTMGTMSHLDRKIKLCVFTYCVASALFEVKKHTLTKIPTKDAVGKVCEGISQTALYLCACADICGTFAATCLVNTRFSRACMISVTEAKLERDDEGGQVAASEASQRVYEIALEVHTSLGTALHGRSIPLSTLLGDGAIEGLGPKERYFLLANDLIDGYDDEGEPLQDPDSDHVALSSDACLRMWSQLRIAVELICDLPWNAPLLRFSPASSQFREYSDALRQSFNETLPAVRNYDLSWTEMSRLCAVRRGEEYVTRLFPAPASGSDHYFECDLKSERDDGSGGTAASRRDGPSTSESGSAVLRALRRSAANFPPAAEAQDGNSGRDETSSNVEPPVQRGLRPPSARDSEGHLSSEPSRRLVTPQTARDTKPSSARSEGAAKQAMIALELALDASPRQDIDSPERPQYRAAGKLASAPVLVVEPPQSPEEPHLSRYGNITRWKESCRTPLEEARHYAAPAMWPKTPEPEIRILLVSPIEMDRLLELRQPAPS